jgi:hypothetical protein
MFKTTLSDPDNPETALAVVVALGDAADTSLRRTRSPAATAAPALFNVADQPPIPLRAFTGVFEDPTPR